MTMEPILHSFTYGVDFLREQVADVDPESMVAQPNGVANHPSWTIGHLAYVCERLGELVGVPQWLPKDWTQRFGPDSTPVADASLYEAKDEALAILGGAGSRLVEAVRQVDDHKLDKIFPDESYRDVFPTIRHAITQVLVGHTAYHVGQVSVWRRAMGLPPMFRSFE